MHIPNSTYRVQLNKDFTFQDLDGIIDYLHSLGISTIYASPVTTATPGSNHGYDVTDPYRINPEIGTLEELKALAAKLKAKGMSWIQDIVPNHMAFTTHNRLLMDVLERGPSSEYYHYFDINWTHPDKTLQGKLMVPVLEADTATCIREGKIAIAFSGRDGFTVNYGESKYPLSASAYRLFTQACIKYDAAFMVNLADIRKKCWENASLKEWEVSKQECLDGCATHEQSLQACIARINQDQALLTELLDNQYYTLVHYATTDTRINYRRFFTVNNLICLAMEEEFVFNDYHRFLHSLYEQGLIQGLRIDHIDGLNDPGAYIRRLRRLFGDECYIIAEKILEATENMPADWALQGTSGYEFLSYVSRVMTDRRGSRKLLDYYHKLLPGTVPVYRETVHEKKQLILRDYMGGELDNLVHYFYTLFPGAEPADREALKQALALVMICLPVYRIYPEQFPLREKEWQLIRQTFDMAYKKNEVLKPELDLLYSLFESAAHDPDSAKKITFLKRLMQFTGPLTAKGVEDTTFYVYNPLISHNEVGDSPSTPATTIEAFHTTLLSRLERNPLSLNATSTHDTKRGEDARIRINLLSEMPEEWEEAVNDWKEINKPFLSVVNDQPAPSVNDEYFLYQSLVGGYPVGAVDINAFTNRLKDYFIKALRESKANTAWNQPEEAYEKACLQFIDQLLNTSHSFMETFLPFQEKISARAFTYSLNQVLIKVTAPGIPDFYQGTELWDQFYVDPDNRNAVDYDIRRQYLAEIADAQPQQLARKRREGLEKLYTIHKALQCRNTFADLFTQGRYIPLYAEGGSVVVAYARVLEADWIITIAPLGAAGNEKEIVIRLPEEAPAGWTDLFTGNRLCTAEGKLLISGAAGQARPALLKNV
ncbi:MAG: malto-oligosyltrehalose synthase [Chitinophagaceae bacterium]